MGPAAPRVTTTSAAVAGATASGRDRKRGGTRREGGHGTAATSPSPVHDDDVLIPVAGILDVLDNYAFVRTTGYLPGPNDVYVPLGMVKKNGLRKGDAVTGAVKAPARGRAAERRAQKFNALVRLDTVNGRRPRSPRSRVEFGKLTPLYPQERLRLETEPNILTTRIIDLVAPIGKGQRGLIVAPPKAGKTMIMQAIANAITTNNPECHLMVVLVDERPEEVTDMQRAVKGEVIASTFDRPAEDHTTVAELAIERAKRLVELGHDVVVLLDSITRLGRAYNLAAPASGRILSGGVDSARALPAEAVLRRRAQHRERRLADHPRDGARRDRLEDGRGDLRGVQGHRQHGAAPRPRRSPTAASSRPSTSTAPAPAARRSSCASEELKIMWKLRRVLARPRRAAGASSCSSTGSRRRETNYEFLTQVQTTSRRSRSDDDEP